MGLAKCVLRRPSAFARRFISLTNAGVDPIVPTASVAAASLALGSSVARRRSRTLMRSPLRRPICDSAGAAL